MIDPCFLEIPDAIEGCRKTWMPQVPPRSKDGDEEKLYLDVYRPARLGSKKAPAMLLIHGGNFMTSSKDSDAWLGHLGF